MALMDSLARWLGQIIAVVLLASIVDLILPNKTMQRYVRLVAGLFILATVAGPVLSWIKGDFSTTLEASLQRAEQTQRNTTIQLAAIEEEGARLRERQTATVLGLVEDQLAAAIRQEVERSTEQRVQHVKVTADQTAEGSAVITEVIVVLADETGRVAHETGRSAHEEAVATNLVTNAERPPIADVDIQIEVNTWPERREETQADAERDQPDTQLQARIASQISKVFELPESIVKVEQVNR